MAAKKSFMAPRAQVPTAIGLSVVFAILLVWRMGGKAGENDSPEASVQAASMMVLPEAGGRPLMDRLKRILADYETRPSTAPPRSDDPPALEGNPFEGPRPKPLDELDEEDDDPTDEDRAEELREEFLDSIRLTGTCIIGGTRISIVNGNYLRTGDAFEGFVVKEIREREIVLEDGRGIEVIGFEGRPE